MPTLTALAMSNATWLPPLSESLPNNFTMIVTMAINTSIGMNATEGFGSSPLFISAVSTLSKIQIRGKNSIFVPCFL